MVTALIFSNVFVFVLGCIIWKLFLRYHRRYDLHRDKAQFSFFFLERHHLFLFYLFHFLIFMIIVSLLVYYVW